MCDLSLGGGGVEATVWICVLRAKGSLGSRTVNVGSGLGEWVFQSFPGNGSF